MTVINGKLKSFRHCSEKYSEQTLDDDTVEKVYAEALSDLDHSLKCGSVNPPMNLFDVMNSRARLGKHICSGGRQPNGGRNV